MVVYQKITNITLLAQTSTSWSVFNITPKSLIIYVSVQVEKTVLFRVHRYFFERESPYFVRRLNTPASPGKRPPGTEDSSAIILEDVTADHFEKFLWVFYNP